MRSPGDVMAPYRPGDLCRLTFDDGGQRVTEAVPVDRIVAVNDNGCWRVDMTRPRSRTGMSILVDSTGREAP